MPENGNWNENRKLVKSEIERLSDTVERHAEKTTERFDVLEHLIADLRVDLAISKTKTNLLSGFFGVIGGALSAFLYLVVELFVRQK